MQHEALPSFHTLQVKLDSANKLLNTVFNIIRQQNSYDIEERLQILEEMLIPARIQFKNLFKKPSGTKADEALRLRDWLRSKNH